MAVHNALNSLLGGKISSRLCSNPEADASELLENLEQMFPQYYADRFRYSIAHRCVLTLWKDVSIVNP